MFYSLCRSMELLPSFLEVLTNNKTRTVCSSDGSCSRRERTKTQNKQISFQMLVVLSLKLMFLRFVVVASLLLLHKVGMHKSFLLTPRTVLKPQHHPRIFCPFLSVFSCVSDFGGEGGRNSSLFIF